MIDFTTEPGSQIRDHGEAFVRDAGLSHQDGFGRCRHADEIGARALIAGDFGNRLIAGAVGLQIDGTLRRGDARLGHRVPQHAGVGPERGVHWSVDDALIEEREVPAGSVDEVCARHDRSHGPLWPEATDRRRRQAVANPGRPNPGDDPAVVDAMGRGGVPGRVTLDGKDARPAELDDPPAQEAEPGANGDARPGTLGKPGTHARAADDGQVDPHRVDILPARRGFSTLACVILREVLHAHIPVLMPESTVRDAIDKMDLYQFPALVIVDEDHAPIGVITEGDLCRGASTKDNWVGMAAEPALVHATQHPTVASPDTEISDAFHRMLMSGLTLLPVVWESRLIGVVMRMDLMQAMLVDAAEHQR